MPQRIVQVDAFAERPFAGNPAAVCLLDGPTEARWMQDVAREMNQAETAFLVAGGDGYQLRWFTPIVEVDLCGHATLASAHLLWEEGHLAPAQTARFHTRSGLLTATKMGDRIELDFPAVPVLRPVDDQPISEALGTDVRSAWRSRFDVLVEVESEEIVRALEPDMGLLEAIPARGVIVTAASRSGSYDFVSRFFAPQSGVPEDPVTGSAHCVLAPYWAGKLGRDELLGYQASPRGGFVEVRVAGDRVMLRGRAVTVFRGELVADPPHLTPSIGDGDISPKWRLGPNVGL